MRLRSAAVAATTVALLAASSPPAVAAWLTSSDPFDSTNGRLRVDSAPRVAAGGWQVRWDLQIVCPRGRQITGRALVAERDPAAIPQLAGEDQGITAIRDLTGGRGERCTGRRQTLHLTLRVRDTEVFDPATGTTVTFHEPIHRTPPTRTSAAVQLFSPESPEDGGFFVQYCSAPNCASESGPRVTLR